MPCGLIPGRRFLTGLGGGKLRGTIRKIMNQKLIHLHWNNRGHIKIHKDLGSCSSSSINRSWLMLHSRNPLIFYFFAVKSHAYWRAPFKVLNPDPMPRRGVLNQLHYEGEMLLWPRSKQKCAKKIRSLNKINASKGINFPSHRQWDSSNLRIFLVFPSLCEAFSKNILRHGAIFTGQRATKKKHHQNPL